MLVSSFFHIPSLIALGVIALILFLSIIASIIWPKPADKIQQLAEATKTADQELVTTGAEKEPQKSK